MRGAVDPRRVARFAAAAAAVLLAGLLPGTDSAASGPDGTLTVVYSCRFPAGTQQSGTQQSGGQADQQTAEISVAFDQVYPTAGAVASAVQPGRLTAAVTVPEDAATALLPTAAATVSATATLTAQVAQGASTAAAEWPGLTAPEAPATGEVVLTLAGSVPPLSVTAAGDVRFAAGPLDLTLHPRGAAATTPPATPPDTPSATASDPTTTTATAADPAVGTGTAATGDVTVPAGPAAVLADVTATCTPKDGQDTVLGSVPVEGAGTPAPSGTGTPTGPGSPSTTGTPTGTPTSPGTGSGSGQNGTIQLAAPPHSGLHDCPAPPDGEPDPAILAKVPRPPGAVVYPGPNDPPFPAYSQCGFVTGYANVGKLKGASVVNDLTKQPQLANIVQKSTVTDFTSSDPLQWYFEIDSIAQMQLPPTDATFLTYGFMPTSATMALTPLGLMTVVTVGSGTQGTISTSTIYGKQELRLYNVKVNGTPLDVGADCHTVQPLDIKLVGYDRSSLTGVPTRPQDYSVQTGGPLAQDDLYIPPFTGCTANGEDLDALFTTAISGHGNSLNLIQGPLCVPVAQSGCDPEIAFPEPPHH